MIDELDQHYSMYVISQLHLTHQKQAVHVTTVVRAQDIQPNVILNVCNIFRKRSFFVVGVRGQVRDKPRWDGKYSNTHMKIKPKHDLVAFVCWRATRIFLKPIESVYAPPYSGIPRCIARSPHATRESHALRVCSFDTRTCVSLHYTPQGVFLVVPEGWSLFPHSPFL